MSIICKPLELVMDLCYFICKNYGLAIVLFTLFSKIVLLPVSVWVQKNSIKLVKMQPEINFMKAKYYGDQDIIAEKQSEIYKREKYNPFASVIPLIIQILLLIGLIEVIKQGINTPNINLNFYGVDISVIPSENGLAYIFAPIVAGATAWLLCVVQNKSNVLQSESSKANKYGTMAISVGISLYLGWFVPIGVAIYWIASNIMSIIQLYILNWVINPKKYVDYKQLEKSKKELEQLAQIGSSKNKISKEDKRREKADYKSFFSVVNKHLVFYSESSGFYKYFEDIIEYLLQNTNIVIHYVTSDPKDAIFEKCKNESKLRCYYIGEKRLITLMMKMDADIVVMTMPDLENYHIKRSYVRKDIQYIFIPHSMCSLNLTMRNASMDHFDTIFCTGKHQKEEIEKTEIAYKLQPKKLIEWGYCLLDKMRRDYQRGEEENYDVKKILIAPSWQKDNIVDSCLEQILDSLKNENYQITVRPHPQHVRHQPERMEQLKERYRDKGNIEIQTDFSANNTVFEADMMITDWSGIAYEYSFTTYKPVLFVDTPVKIMNPEYQRIDTEPFNIWMREKIGKIIKIEDINKTASVVKEMLNSVGEYNQEIKGLAYEYVYNLDGSGKVGALYIVNELQNIIKRKKEGDKL